MGTCWIVVRMSIDMGVNTTIISSGFDAALPTCHATGVTLQNMSRYRRHDPLSSQHTHEKRTLQISPFRLSTTTTTLPVHLGTRGNERGGESRRNTCMYVLQCCRQCGSSTRHCCAEKYPHSPQRDMNPQSCWHSAFAWPHKALSNSCGCRNGHAIRMMRIVRRS